MYNHGSYKLLMQTAFKLPDFQPFFVWFTLLFASIFPWKACTLLLLWGCYSCTDSLAWQLLISSSLTAPTVY